MTPREERFANLLVQGLTQAEAFRTAYPHARRWKAEAVWSNASTLARKVQQRVEDLRKIAGERALERAELDRAFVLERLMKNARICMGEEPAPGRDGELRYDPTAANRALELLGKTDELGLFIDRSETANTNFVIAASSDEDDNEMNPEVWAAKHRPH